MRCFTLLSKKQTNEWSEEVMKFLTPLMTAGLVFVPVFSFSGELTYLCTVSNSKFSDFFFLCTVEL